MLNFIKSKRLIFLYITYSKLWKVVEQGNFFFWCGFITNLTHLFLLVRDGSGRTTFIICFRSRSQNIDNDLFIIIYSIFTRTFKYLTVINYIILNYLTIILYKLFSYCIFVITVSIIKRFQSKFWAKSRFSSLPKLLHHKHANIRST